MSRLSRHKDVYWLPEVISRLGEGRFVLAKGGQHKGLERLAGGSCGEGRFWVRRAYLEVDWSLEEGGTGRGSVG